MAFEALAAQPGRPHTRERAQRAICHLAQPSAESGWNERRSRSLEKQKSITAAGERRQVRDALNALTGLLHTDHSAGEAAERY